MPARNVLGLHHTYTIRGVIKLAIRSAVCLPHPVLGGFNSTRSGLTLPSFIAASTSLWLTALRMKAATSGCFVDIPVQ